MAAEQRVGGGTAGGRRLGVGDESPGRQGS